eukprot:3720809-Pleurochrysis_carterae.AAC.2
MSKASHSPCTPLKEAGNTTITYLLFANINMPKEQEHQKQTSVKEEMKQRRVNSAMDGVPVSLSRPGLKKRKVAAKGIAASVRTSVCRSNFRGIMP